MACCLSRPAAALAFACLLYGAPVAIASDAAAPLGTAAVQTPHIALLLPTGSKLFGRHAVAVRDGFRTAAKTQGQSLLPVREYVVTEGVANVLEGYRTAVAAGAQVVVGPLTRDAVTALAFGEPVPVPTLGLNVADNVGRAPPNLYMLSLQVEPEARQAAQLAWNDGRRTVITVTGDGPVQRRKQAAFAAEFERLGGSVAGEFDVAADPDWLQEITLAAEIVDAAFLALTFSEARNVRAYLGPGPVYATSSANIGDAGPIVGYDFSNVSFVDMPWLLEPNHAAVMIYPRPSPPMAIEFERLYALGIDAWRIAQLLLTGLRDIRLDGVTGLLTLGNNGQFERELVAARYVGGAPRLLQRKSREPAR